MPDILFRSPLPSSPATNGIRRDYLGPGHKQGGRARANPPGRGRLRTAGGPAHPTVAGADTRVRGYVVAEESVPAAPVGLVDRAPAPRAPAGRGGGEPGAGVGASRPPPADGGGYPPGRAGGGGPGGCRGARRAGYAPPGAPTGGSGAYPAGARLRPRAPAGPPVPPRARAAPARRPQTPLEAA